MATATVAELWTMDKQEEEVASGNSMLQGAEPGHFNSRSESLTGIYRHDKLFPKPP